MSERRLLIGAPLFVGGFAGMMWSALRYRHEHPEMDGQPVPIDLWPLSEWDTSDTAVLFGIALLVGFVLVGSRLMDYHYHCHDKSCDHDHGHSRSHDRLR